MVPLVEKINYRHHIHCRSIFVSGVNVIAECDKTDIASRKDVVDILSDLNIISAKTAQIFDDYKIDLPRFRVLKQPSNARTIKIGAAKSVICRANSMVQTVNRIFDNECPLHSAEGIFYKDGAEICVSNILDFEIEMFRQVK